MSTARTSTTPSSRSIRTSSSRADLNQDIGVSRRFDLAMSVEVAEHLPAARAASFVGTLARLADVVLFSAAVPGQSGTFHINEQWPTYWISLFAENGFNPIDVIRPAVWTDERVGFWYAQNVFLYANANGLEIAPVAAGQHRSKRRPSSGIARPSEASRRAAPPPGALLRRHLLDQEAGASAVPGDIVAAALEAVHTAANIESRSARWNSRQSVFVSPTDPRDAAPVPKRRSAGWGCSSASARTDMADPGAGSHAQRSGCPSLPRSRHGVLRTRVARSFRRE